MFEVNNEFEQTSYKKETCIGNRDTYSLYVKAVSLHMSNIYDMKNRKKLLFYGCVFEVS